MVTINILHKNITGTIFADIKFNNDLNYDQFKEKIYTIVGTEPNNMIIYLMQNNKPIKVTKFDKLGNTNIIDKSIVLICEIDSNIGQTSLIYNDENQNNNVKFVLSREKYLSNPNSVHYQLKKLKNNKPLLFDKNNRDQKQYLDTILAKFNIQSLSDLKKYNIEVTVNELNSKGRMLWYGQVSKFISNKYRLFKPLYVGVRLYNQEGYYDGIDQDGICNFDCNNKKYGIFVEPRSILIEELCVNSENTNKYNSDEL